MALGLDGYIYSSGSTNNVIARCDSAGILWAKLGGTGDNPPVVPDGKFRWLGSVAADSQGNVYAADTQLSRIQKFTSWGTFIMKWGPEYQGGSFGNIVDIAVDTAGDVYVADGVARCQVKKFNPDGVLLAQWGSCGKAPGQSEYLTSIAVDAGGNIYTTDRANDVPYMVSKFSPSGVFLKGWGTPGTGPGQFNNPRAIGVDGGGNVYVLDAGNQRVQKFTSNGTYLAERFFGNLDNPVNLKDMAVDAVGNVYVMPGLLRFTVE